MKKGPKVKPQHRLVVLIKYRVDLQTDALQMLGDILGNMESDDEVVNVAVEEY